MFHANLIYNNVYRTHWKGHAFGMSQNNRLTLDNNGLLKTFVAKYW